MRKWGFWGLMCLVSLFHWLCFFQGTLEAFNKGIPGVDNQAALLFIPVAIAILPVVLTLAVILIVPAVLVLILVLVLVLILVLVLVLVLILVLVLVLVLVLILILILVLIVEQFLRIGIVVLGLHVRRVQFQ